MWQSRIVLKKPSALDSNRARNSTPESVDYFYNNLDKTLSEVGLHDCPERIYDMDETGIKSVLSIARRMLLPPPEKSPSL
ncbi:hypothetical protein DPMN_029534 [Dreissena polymorpha]|uniref:Uncharacterized protein n=1 Tax=Dreissena polymorpha TaxID=45954 RepID=A0A9D4LYC9_DREPO|nr:hypothetical protein DPMN_029534 [Dreissena polymorpha]